MVNRNIAANRGVKEPQGDRPGASEGSPHNGRLPGRSETAADIIGLLDVDGLNAPASRLATAAICRRVISRKLLTRWAAPRKIGTSLEVQAAESRCPAPDANAGPDQAALR